MLALADLPDSSDTGEWTFIQRTMFSADASCMPGEGSWISLEDRLLELSETLSLSSEQVEASVTFTARDDSSSSVFLRRGGLEALWPGTPWIGAGLSRSLSTPFIPGLRDPILDWSWADIDSVSAVHASLGGFLGTTLGFDGYLLPGGDTATVFVVDAPWLGIGSMGYTSMDLSGADSTLHMDVFEALLDLRAVEPWIVITSSGRGADSTAVLFEADGFAPLSGNWGELELVPVLSWAGDSISCPGGAFERGHMSIGLDAVLHPVAYALSGVLSCRYDPADPKATTGGLAADMTSEGGFSHSVSAAGLGGPSWIGMVSSTLRGARASMGGGMEFRSDSLRIGGSAGYSPTNGVHALLEISASAQVEEGDSPQPCGSFSAVFSRRGVRALLRLLREDGETTIAASLCAVFP